MKTTFGLSFYESLYSLKRALIYNILDDVSVHPGCCWLSLIGYRIKTVPNPNSFHKYKIFEYFPVLLHICTYVL
jgi:hypothetical protein